MFGFMQRVQFCIGAIAVALMSLADAGMKFFTIANFSDGNSVHLLPFIDFFLHKNPGITGDIPVPMWIIAPVTIGVLLFLIDRTSVQYREQPIPTLGVIAVIAGATNNFIDRLVNGFTTDYLMLFNTSIINISDVLIIGGVLIILLYNKTNPHALYTINPSSPPTQQYGVVSRMFRSIVRAFRNSSHR